jgi:hypothetical protein
MIFRRYAVRPLEPGFVADQGDNVARAGVLNCLMQAGERTNVNHEVL